MDKSNHRRRAVVVWFREYQLKERIWGFSLMEIFGPLLIVAIIIGIIQY
jgi:hypothetical protein